MMQKLAFTLITDLHYFENSLGAEGEAYEARSLTDQKCIAETGAIIDSAFALIAADTEPDIILIAGDMTFNGEAESHKAMKQKLDALREAGKTIYMITGNHDGNHEAYAFSGAERIPVEETRREDLQTIYHEYMTKHAIAVYGDGICYVARLGPGVRLLGINYDLGPKNSGVETYMDWIIGQIEEAKASGDLIFGMMHVPLLPGSPMLSLVGDAKIAGWEDIAARLAGAGLPLIFTGHMHMQSVNKLTTPGGNFIYDICTGSLVGGPCAIRKISIDENWRMTIKTSTVTQFDWNKNGMTAQEYFVWRFERKIADEIFSMLKKRKLVAKLARNITLGMVSRLLLFRADASLRQKKLLDVAIELVRNIFYGDQPYIHGTVEYAYVMKLLRRLRLLVRIAEKKLSAKSELFRDIPALAASLIGKEVKIDSNAVIDLRTGIAREI